MRPGSKALFSAAGVALVAGCLVLVNMLSSRLYLRLDLSQGKVYSLSPGSKRLLKKLPGPVEVRVYFSKELPPEYAANRAYVKDLLSEYRSASGGKVRSRFVDIDKDEESKTEALKQGIAPVQFNVISREKYEVRDAFMGLALQFEDKKEVLPVIPKTESLEYDLTTRLLRLTSGKRSTIGILDSHGALGPKELHPLLRESLSRNYEIAPVDLSSLKPGTTIGAEVSALMVLGPSEKLEAGALYALDQFLLSGRPVVAALDARKADFRSYMATSVETGLPELLRAYGVEMGSNFVLDEQCQKVGVSRGWFSNIIPFATFPIATDLSADHPVTRHLQSVTLPLVSRVDAGAFQGKVTALARSSRYSWMRGAWERNATHSISPLQNLRPEPADVKGPFTLAAALEGPFPSGFGPEKGGRPLPPGADPKRFIARGPENGRLLVVGTSLFARPGMPAAELGAVFLENLADWLLLDSDLIAIRSKQAVFRPLREIEPGFKTFLRWLNILLPGLLAVAFGAYRAGVRSRQRRRRTTEYSPATHETSNA